MSFSRRKFLQQGACIAAIATVDSGMLSTSAAQQHDHDTKSRVVTHGHPTIAPPSRPPLHPDALAQFVDPLPIPAFARPVGTATAANAHNSKTPHYRIEMRAIDVKIHRDVSPTRMWCYVDASNPAPHDCALGPTFNVQNGKEISVEWRNSLPAKHFLPIDHTLHGAGKNVPDVRTAVHVHGAKVPADSDGFPDDWFTPGHSVVYRYPLQQDAATLWYHDHAMGIERLNQYAGLYGFFFVQDESQNSLNLPSGQFDIPLAIADRLFYADGQLRYPDSGDHESPWIPEVYGDAILVNGKLFPYLDVQPRAYRFRLLNASNTRSYIFSLSGEKEFQQIGSDQGLLASPARIKSLALSPGERAEIVIDFRGEKGRSITLQNQAWTLMQFRIGSGADQPFAQPAALRTIHRIPTTASVRTRTMTLNEYMDPQSHRMLMLLNGTYWHQPVTEKPELNSTEIWEFINLTQDIHPIHLHLVRFQILDRRAFDADDYLNFGKFNYLGNAFGPAPGEKGWKDTVQAYPEMVTRIIIPFSGYTGRYVWHCHLLEHAANEMMRPMEIVPPKL